MYVDDMIVKFSKGKSRATDVEDVLASARMYVMRLNFAKFSFKV